MIIDRIIHGIRVLAECDENYSRMAVSVLDVFEKLAASGTRLRAGTRVRFGWSLLHLGEDGDSLRVMEPDFARWPEQHWIQNINTTLKVLAAQTSLLNSLDISGEDAFFDQMIISAPGALEQPDIFLRRGSSISEEDSGWLLGSIENPEQLNEDILEPELIAGLAARRPALLQVLTLPPGFVVIFSGDSINRIFDPEGHVIV